MTTASENWHVELRHSWAVLAPPIPPDEIVTSPLPLVVAGTAARIGTDTHGSRHLLVPAADDEDPAVDHIEGALTVRLKPYSFGRRVRRYLDITCARTDLFDLFDELVVDVLTGLSTTDPGPAGTAATLVHRWRTLLSAGPRRILTFAEQLSLLGELHVLDLVHPAGPIDITTWRGPLREPHDIVQPHRALEVKTIGPTSDAVDINGVHQLEPPGRPLALVLVTVTATDPGTSLPEFVDRVLARVDDRGEALRRLGRVGYHPADRGHYEATTFTVTDIDHVRVGADTPRIVPSSFVGGDIPRGVGDLGYRIPLGSLHDLTVRGVTALQAWTHEDAG
jgi:hypothetical protein